MSVERRAARRRQNTEAPARPPIRFPLEQATWAAVIAALVLVFSTELDLQFTLPKLLTLQVATPVLIALWIWRSVHHGVRPLSRPILIAASSLVGWWIFTTVTAVHVPTALDGEFGRFNGLWTHLLFLTLFTLLASSKLTMREIDGRLAAMVCALAACAVFCLAQYGGWDPIGWNEPRPGSTIGNPVPLAACFGLAVPLAIAFGVRASGLARRAMWIAVAALLFLAALSTVSRGPLLGIVASVLILGWTVTREHVAARRKVMIAAVIFAVATVLVGSRLRSGRFLPSIDWSFQDRQSILTTGFQMARDYPLHGVGLENFAVVYPRYRTPASELLTPDEIPSAVHNGYLQTAATTGVPGLLLYLILVGSVMLPIWRRRGSKSPDSVMSAAFAASIAGYLVADLTGWLEVSLTGLFWILLGLAAASEPGDSVTEIHGWRRVVAAGLAGAAAVMICVQVVRSTRIAQADHAFRLAASAAGRADWPAERDGVERGLAAAGGVPHFVEAAGLSYARRFGATGQQELFARAALLFNTAHDMNPFNEYALIHRLDLETAALQKHQRPIAPDAQAALRIIESQDLNNGAAVEAVARLRLASGDLVAALQASRRAESLRPARSPYMTVTGDIHHAMHRLPEAVASYGAAIARAEPGSPSWIDASHKITVSLLELGDASTALAHAREIVRVIPGDAIGHQLLTLAEAQTRAKEANR